MKLNGFPERLAVFINDRRLMPYEWGVNDCVVFAADAIHAITGEDPIADIRGQWNDEESAMALLASLGGLITVCDSKFQRRPSPEFAQRGDLCFMVIDNDVTSLGVCTGGWAAAPGGPGIDEVMLTPMSLVRVAWEV